jgi:hypothetical protein
MDYCMLTENAHTNDTFFHFEAVTPTFSLWFAQTEPFVGWFSVWPDWLSTNPSHHEASISMLYHCCYVKHYICLSCCKNPKSWYFIHFHSSIDHQFRGSNVIEPVIWKITPTQAYTSGLTASGAQVILTIVRHTSLDHWFG